jgi:hypothetical protein
MPRYRSKSELALETVMQNPASTPSQILQATKALDKIRKQRIKNRPKPAAKPEPPTDPASICDDCDLPYDDCTCLVEPEKCPTCEYARSCEGCKGFEANSTAYMKLWEKGGRR